MIRIICINKSEGYHDNPHEAVSFYGWISDENQKKGKTDRITMVDWIKNKKGIAYVTDKNDNKVYCYVNRSVNGTEFLQTQSDGRFTNNLLELPECQTLI